MNVDLMRRLLFVLEKSPNRRVVDRGKHGLVHAIAVDGFDEAAVSYHIQLLMESPWTSKEIDDDGGFLLSLSFAGHEFVELMRPDHIWAVAKSDVKGKTGGHNLSLIEGRLKP